MIKIRVPAMNHKKAFFSPRCFLSAGIRGVWLFAIGSALNACALMPPTLSAAVIPGEQNPMGGCVCETGGEGLVPAAALEEKVETILAKLTLEEQVKLCLGAGNSGFAGVERLGLAGMRCTDGPRGPNGAGMWGPDGTAFPAPVAMGATWDPDLLLLAGEVMGKETRAIGATMLLGPCIDIQRNPLHGRFFESYTEDPHLNSRLSVAKVKGIQGQKVAACAKHFVCNHREENRNFFMSMVDRRTLEEIHFPAFKAAVEEANLWAVMTAANGVNGDFVSDSKELLNETLKDRWGFDGMVITDWVGTRSLEKAAFAGLDVAMPFKKGSPFGSPLLAAVRDGRIPGAVVGDKARRVLRTMARVGLLDGVEVGSGGLRNAPEHQAVARRVAAEGLVLLKNDGDVLPLDSAGLRKLLVVGTHADTRFCLPKAGGSSWVSPPYEITPLQGLMRAVSADAIIKYLPCDELAGFRPLASESLKENDGAPRGFAATYSNAGSRRPEVETSVPEIDFVWEMRSPDVEKIQPRNFRAVFSGVILPPLTGTYTFRMTTGAGKGKLVDEKTFYSPLATTDSAQGVYSSTASMHLEAGQPYSIRLEYDKTEGDGLCRLEWALPENPDQQQESLDRLRASAAEADAVLIFAGLDHGTETEARDRTDMKLPPAQEVLLQALASVNPRTVVVLINGSPVEIGDWVDKVPAWVEVWYPGMEGGNAIADVLFGKINPSGKLPFTWPKKLDDSPSHKLARQDADFVHYDEGVFVGYRYFDTRNVEPQFPFGHGLSYTTFEYGNLQVVPEGEKVKVSFTVTNRGKAAGAEVAQLYVGAPEGASDRPVHELKGFRKVFLQPGETGTVQIELGPEAFATFNVDQKKWVVPDGDYTIKAGGSSRALPLQKKVRR
jgi:beta-glucosidase